MRTLNSFIVNIFLYTVFETLLIYITYNLYLYFQIKVDHHPTSDSGIKVVCDYDEEEEKTCLDSTVFKSFPTACNDLKWKVGEL